MATWPERRPDERPTTEMSVLERERARVLARLRTECTEGRISLDQFSDLVGEAFAAGQVEDLRAINSALAPPAAPFGSPAVRPPGRYGSGTAHHSAKASQLAVAVFGSSVRRGRFHLEDGTTALALFGDCHLDLTDATIDGPEAVLNAVSMFGNVTVTVPDGIAVTVQGVSMFGDRRCDVEPFNRLPGDPSVVVRAWAVFGDIRIRSPKAGARR